MKEQFKTKTLLFYGLTIGFVILLFNLVAAYGEKNLKAPPNFGGRYISTQAPPECPDSTRLVLTIQQSGIFLNGLLSLQEESAGNANATTMATERGFPLSGRWVDQQINLTGTTNAFDACRSPGATYPIPTTVIIQGQVDQLSASQSPQAHTPTTFTGELTVDEVPPSWSFTAQRQATEEKQDAH